MNRPCLEVADVFRDHGEAFLDRYGDTLCSEQRRALRDSCQWTRIVTRLVYPNCYEA